VPVASKEVSVVDWLWLFVGSVYFFVGFCVYILVIDVDLCGTIRRHVLLDGG